MLGLRTRIERATVGIYRSGNDPETDVTEPEGDRDRTDGVDAPAAVARVGRATDGRAWVRSLAREDVARRAGTREQSSWGRRTDERVT
jgi:hypothetical protein